MSFGIPDDFKELIRDRTNLVDLVNDVVPLEARRAGQDYVGLCPFHDDHNPSFHVYPDRNGGNYRCWVCEKAGDCFSWVQEIHRLSFPEAIEFLAERLDLEVPRRAGGRNAEAHKQKEALYEVTGWAAHEFHTYLMTSADAAHVREYLGGRGYDEEILRTFKLGFHPDSWTWLLDRARNKYSQDQLFRTGLIGVNKRGGYYDNLIDRVVFPIRDDRERVVAFGGRILPGSDQPAKYWNSPEGELFHKSNQLYAFDRAREPIRRSGTTIVVEGYTDCISCHQHGITNVVATLGTALTAEHVSKIRRFGRRVVLVYDGDDPGQKAAERVIGRILGQEVDLRVLTLPDGEDPADLLSRAGAEEFERLADQAPEAIEYKFDRLVERNGTDSIQAKEVVRDEMLELLATVPNLNGTDRLDIILGRLARKLMTEEWRIRNKLEQLVKQKRRRSSFQSHEKPVEPAPPTPTAGVEAEVLEILFIQPDQLEPIVQEIGPDDFENPRLRALFERILDLSEGGSFDGAASVLTSLDENLDLKQVTVSLADAAREKNIEQLLRADVVPGQPPYLGSVLSAIKLRRNERQKELSKQHLSQSASDLNSDTADALRRLTQFQLERMRHPSTLK